MQLIDDPFHSLINLSTSCGNGSNIKIPPIRAFNGRCCVLNLKSKRFSEAVRVFLEQFSLIVTKKSR